MPPVGTIFPASHPSALGLYGRILPDGGIEYGYLVLNEDGTEQRWVNQTDAAKEAH